MTVRRSLLRRGLALLLLGLGPGGAVAQEDGEQEKVEQAVESLLAPRTESASREFVVHGGDLQLRSAVAGLAEEIKEDLDKQVGKGDGWKHVTVLQLQQQPPGERRPRSFQPVFQVLPDGFRLELNIYNLDRGLDQEQLAREVLKLLLYERTLRDKEAAGFEDGLSLPDWLTEGLLESFRWRKQEGDRELYEALFKQGSVFSVESVLEADDIAEMGAGERAAFKASAGALVMALLGQEGGKEGMASLLGEVAVFKGQQEALLKKHFPGMNLGPSSLGKWWALQLAKMAERPVTQTMTVLETEAALEKALVVMMEDEERGTIEFRPEQFRDLLAIPSEERIALMKPMSDQLNLMAFRAFPGYRPIIIGYLTVLADIARENDAEIDQRLSRLADRRMEMVELGKRVRDYMEWYRITSAQDVSGAFSDYLALKKQLEEERSQNRGPVADYLRDMQKIYERD